MHHTCQEGSTGHVKHRFQLLSGLSHALSVASTVIIVDGGVNETRSPIALNHHHRIHYIMSAEQGRGSVRGSMRTLFWQLRATGCTVLTLHRVSSIVARLEHMSCSGPMESGRN